MAGVSCLGVKGGSGENFAKSERGCDPYLWHIAWTSLESTSQVEGPNQTQDNRFLCATQNLQQVNYLVLNWRNYSQICFNDTQDIEQKEFKFEIWINICV